MAFDHVDQNVCRNYYFLSSVFAEFLSKLKVKMAFVISNIVLLINENVNVNVKGLPIEIVVFHLCHLLRRK